MYRWQHGHLYEAQICLVKSTGWMDLGNWNSGSCGRIGPFCGCFTANFKNWFWSTFWQSNRIWEYLSVRNASYVVFI